MNALTARRPLWRWLAGGILFALALPIVSLATRSILSTAAAQALAFAIAWAAWWPVFRPKVGFWLHSVSGAVVAVLVAAVLNVLGVN